MDWLLGVIVVAALWLLYTLVARRRLPANAPPVHAEFPTLPLLGSLVQFATEPRDFILRGHAAHGECFSVVLFGRRMTFLVSNDGHETFFKATEEHFDIREAYKFCKVTFGPGVCYDCPLKTMYQQFGLVKTGMEGSRFHRYVDIVQRECDEYFTREWGDAGEGCIYKALSELFTLTSAHCLMGDEIRAQWDGGYAEAYRHLDHSFVPLLFFFPSLPNPSAAKCVAARTKFERIFREIVEARRRDGAKKDDFLQTLMEATYKDGTPLSLQEITGVMMGTLLGGQHTSNVTGAWLMLHLLRSPEWRRRVVDEQRRLFALPDDAPDNDARMAGALSYDQTVEMSEFQLVLDETLRLHPPFFQLARVVSADTQFKQHTIPKGDFVCISPGAAMRTRELWGDDAANFRPSRMRDDERKTRPKYAWIPFGGGRHVCSGKKFAIVSLKTALAWLLRNYELEFDDALPFPKPDYTTMVVAPSAPTRIRYRRKRFVGAEKKQQ